MEIPRKFQDLRGFLITPLEEENLRRNVLAFGE